MVKKNATKLLIDDQIQRVSVSLMSVIEHEMIIK